MSLLANDKYDTSLRGIEWKSDTIKVAIPIELLRKANIKMIERKYFKKIIIEQDSIITLKDKYILEQENVINDFQKRLLVNAKLNETIRKDLEREKVKSKIFGGIAGVAIVVTIVTILIKQFIMESYPFLDYINEIDKEKKYKKASECGFYDPYDLSLIHI